MTVKRSQLEIAYFRDFSPRFSFAPEVCRPPIPIGNILLGLIRKNIRCTGSEFKKESTTTKKRLKNHIQINHIVVSFSQCKVFGPLADIIMNTV